MATHPHLLWTSIINTRILPCGRVYGHSTNRLDQSHEEAFTVDKPTPANVIRFSRIKVTIWANESANGPWYNVQVCRLYKDGSDWKQSDSFGRDDLPLVCKALDHAHTWIHQQPHTERESV